MILLYSFEGTTFRYSDNNDGDTPISMPNIEVKPFSADNTRLEMSWEDKTLPESNIQEAEKPMRLVRFLILYMQEGKG